MINTVESKGPAAAGWVIDVLPSRSDPVTHWLVVGPYYITGADTDGQGVMDAMYDDEKEAFRYAREVAKSWGPKVTVLFDSAAMAD